jgi:hypothetical protein
MMLLLLFIFIEQMRGRSERVQRVMKAQESLTDGASSADHRMKDGDRDGFDDCLS